MKIITVSREFGSGGREVGKRLADVLNMDYYDKEILTALSEKTLLDERYLESAVNSGNIRRFPVTFGHTFSYMSNGNHTAELLAEQHKIIREIAERGKDFVIVGRSADLLLKAFHPFNIFIYADIKDRCRRCRERNDTTEMLSDDALKKQIRRIDHSRAVNYTLVSDKKWGDKSEYHLCINTSGREIKELIPIIADFARQYFRRCIE